MAQKQITLWRTLSSSTNGTRIYLCGNKFYTVDGEIDCGSEYAYEDLMYAKKGEYRSLEEALKAEYGKDYQES